MAPGIDTSDQANCGRDKAYVAIIISVLPLWAIITTLIVFALILFHKHIRLTKIYDNCTKQTANYVYHIELRTGDTSATYIRRKTTITIDMFDENQTTLARIAIPGHVIFGRKEAPVAYLDDDKYFELRVTRLWLYRASRLKNVSTIRITHTCMEPEARIMVYGVELRTSEPDRHKLFFPVMNYITPYGTANKINACFDFDPIGSISAMGGRIDQPLASEHLSSVDYTLLVYLYCAFVLYLSTFEVLQDSFHKPQQAAFKGLIIGCLCFAVTYVIGLFMRYVIKQQYSLHVASGAWAYIYHAANLGIFLTSTAIWIQSTHYAYKGICANKYTIWVLSLSVAVIEGFTIAILCSIVAWLISICYPVNTEQFVMPEDSVPATTPTPDQPETRTRDGPSPTTGAQQQPQYKTGEYHSKSRPVSKPPVFTTPGAGSPSNLLAPVITTVSTGYQSPWQAAQPTPMMVGPGYGAYPMYMPQPAPGGHKTYAGYDTAGHYQQAAGTTTGYSPTTRQTQLPTLHHTNQTQGAQNYHQQTTTGGNANASGRTKQTKKTGSQESTGSTYYQQLMKTKGGVKSISQYGELMKQKKQTKR
jgi:hypothetical protein